MGPGMELALAAIVVAATLGTTVAFAQPVPEAQRRFGEVAAECVRLRGAAPPSDKGRLRKECEKTLLAPAPAIDGWVGTVTFVFNENHSISLVLRSAAGPVELEITREPHETEEFAALRAVLRSVNARAGQRLAVTAKFEETVFEVLDDKPSDIRLSFRISVPKLSPLP